MSVITPFDLRLIVNVSYVLSAVVVTLYSLLAFEGHGAAGRPGHCSPRFGGRLDFLELGCRHFGVGAVVFGGVCFRRSRRGVYDLLGGCVVCLALLD